MNAQTAIPLNRQLRVIVLVAAVILFSGFSMRLDGATVTYAYDSLNRLTQATYSDGSVVAYAYDAAGNRLTQVVSKINLVAPQFTSASNTTFTAGQQGIFLVTATGTPSPSFSASNLPSWLDLDPNTGVLSGTPPSSA